MKNKKSKEILIAVGIISIILSLLSKFVFKIESALYIIYLPFEIIGKGLRYLSLSSRIGNIFSIIIYISICLIPVVILFIKKKKSILIKIDYFLIGLCVYMFYAIYNFINPMELYNLLDSEFYGVNGFIEIGKLSVALVFYIIIISYIILIALNSLSKSRLEKGLEDELLFKNLNCILFLSLICDVVLMCYFGVFDILTKIGTKALVFSIIKYIVVVMPIWASMIVIWHMIQFISEFNEDKYGEVVIKEIFNIAEYGKKTVYLCVFSSLFTNITQLIFSQYIGDVNILLNIPFIPLIVAFVGIILANYFKQSKDLFDDNNSII